jgi:hypothetical protein
MNMGSIDLEYSIVYYALENSNIYLRNVREGYE